MGKSKIDVELLKDNINKQVIKRKEVKGDELMDGELSVYRGMIAIVNQMEKEGTDDKVGLALTQQLQGMKQMCEGHRSIGASDEFTDDMENGIKKVENILEIV